MKNALFFFFFLLHSFSIEAQPHNVWGGQTLIVQPQTHMLKPDGIIIHNGGQVIIKSQGYLHIGAGAEIVIKDGGQMSSESGTHITDMSTIPGNDPGWGGIYVEPGTSSIYAISLYGCTISNSLNIGLQVGPQSISINARLIYCEGVNFINNEGAHVLFSGVHSAILGLHKESRFIDCTFSSGPSWQVFTNYTDGVHFDGCNFEAPSSISLHMDGPRNSTIKNCTFRYGYQGIGLHFNSSNNTISGNTFYQSTSDNDDDGNAAILVGWTGNTLYTAENNLISNNHIHPYNTPSINFGSAILLGAYIPNDGNYILNNNTIIGNTIHSPTTQETVGFLNGISIAGASQGLNLIKENAIYGCMRGIYSFHNNSTLQITCNGFENNTYHIYNEGPIGFQTLDFKDPNNRFYGNQSAPWSYDIFNTSWSNTFLYNINGGFSTPESPTVNHQVSLGFATAFAKCDVVVEPEMLIGYGDDRNTSFNEDEKGNLDNFFTLKPNPANTYIELENIYADKEIVKILIYNTAGKLVKEIDSEMALINVSEFPAGAYWLKAVYENGEIKTEPFMVVK